MVNRKRIKLTSKAVRKRRKTLAEKFSLVGTQEIALPKEFKEFLDLSRQWERSIAESHRVRIPPGDVAKVYRCAQQGMTVAQIAHIFGVSRDGFNKILQRSPLIRQAMVCGRANAVDFATKQLWDLVKKHNLGAIQFWLKNRAGWLEKFMVSVTQEMEQLQNTAGTTYDNETGEVLTTELLNKLEDDELDQLIEIINRVESREKELDKDND